MNFKVLLVFILTILYKSCAHGNVAHISQTWKQCVLEYSRRETQLRVEHYNNECKVTPDPNTSKCSDPKEEVILEKYMELNYLFENLGALANQDDFEKYYPNIKIFQFSITNDSYLWKYGETDCLSNNRLEIFNRGLCPWFYYIEDRPNKLPRYQPQAHCLNCEKSRCSKTDDKKTGKYHGCQEHKIIQPVLYREENECSNGQYIWKPGLEYVSVGCLCMPINTPVE